MSQRRAELDKILRDLLGSKNVYYQPPNGIQLKYPCIVYNLDAEDDVHANNDIYRRLRRYSLTYMTKDPDDPKREELNDLRYCRFIRAFANDNLNHYVYTIYH